MVSRHSSGAQSPHQIFYYTQLVGLIDFYLRWDILPFSEIAADQFEALRRQRIRIGTMDLKIASIALEADALLLSANLRDFERVPGLRVEPDTVSRWLRIVAASQLPMRSNLYVRMHSTLAHKFEPGLFSRVRISTPRNVVRNTGLSDG